ncbi:MAG: glycosyltransferase family 39 protein [Chloroflexi bacterium]|nr:glycosyltransferase family 39 protein [Chloroflexota bacterium]
MSRKPSSSNWGNGRYLIAILLILILAFALRLHNLTADAPLGISPTLELSLDGPATIMAGRDMALFGQWQAVPGPHQLEIMYPFMNWLAFVIFRLVGSGYWSANFISVVSGVLSVALVAGFARQHFGRRAALIAAFFLAINYIFIIYNRDPMAYTTVACSMAFVLYAWGRGLRQPVWFFNSERAPHLPLCLLNYRQLPLYPQRLLLSSLAHLAAAGLAWRTAVLTSPSYCSLPVVGLSWPPGDCSFTRRSQRPSARPITPERLVQKRR